MKYIFGFIGIILLVTGVFWVLGWLMVPGQVTSADNVQQQWAFAYQYDESLKAIATQVCTADKAVDTAMSDEEKAISRAESEEGTLKERDVGMFGRLSPCATRLRNAGLRRWHTSRTTLVWRLSTTPSCGMHLRRSMWHQTMFHASHQPCWR